MTAAGPRKKIVGVALDDFMDGLVAKEAKEKGTTASSFFAHLAAQYFNQPEHDPYHARAPRKPRKRKDEGQGELQMAV